MNPNTIRRIIAFVLSSCFIFTGYLIVYDLTHIDFGVFGMITMHFFGSLLNLLLNGSGDIDQVNPLLFSLGQLIQFSVVFVLLNVISKLFVERIGLKKS